VKYYVLTDEHATEIYEFDTEEEAIAFCDQSEIMDINVHSVFKGERLEVETKTRLVPVNKVQQPADEPKKTESTLSNERYEPGHIFWI